MTGEFKPREVREVRCTLCHGSGKITTLIACFGPNARREYAKCPRCNGKGKLKTVGVDSGL